MEIDGGDAIGHKVFVLGINISLFIPTRLVLLKVILIWNQIFGDQVVVNKSSVLAQYFGDVEYEQKVVFTRKSLQTRLPRKQILLNVIIKSK